jgi:curli biogenesis system outer membrane secretion channel CsgG
MLAVTALVTLPMPSAQADRTVLAVLAFDDHSGALAGHGSIARTLRERVTLELRAHGFEVLGQEQLAAVLNPEQLTATASLAPAAAAKIGRLSGARYLLSGTITGYDEQVGTSYKKSLLASGGRYERVAEGGNLSLDLAVIDARDGKVVYTRSIGGHSATQRSELPANPDEMAREAKTGPGARAVGAAVIEIADYLECELIRRDNCLVEYEQEEAPAPGPKDSPDAR